jgi:hypothetical protein
MCFLKISTFLHTRLAAETHLAHGEFIKVTENGDDNDDDDTQDECIREAGATLTMLNYKPGMIYDNEFQKE